MNPIVDPIVDALKRFTTPFPGDVKDLPPEPEQTFLLGNRYADYGLAVVFALAFPMLRAVLRRLVYVVRPCSTQCTDDRLALHPSPICMA